MEVLLSSARMINGAAKAIFLTLALVVLFTSATLGQEDNDESSRAIALFNAGQDAHEKGDLKTAIDNYEKALKIFPEFPEAELQRGNALQSLGNLDAAETAFRRAVELREDWSLAIANLGSVLVKKGKFAEAEKQLTEAIELDELNFPAFAAMTELRLRTKADPKVLSLLLARITLLTDKANPTASIWASRAALEIAVGDRTSAKASAARALTLDPKSQFALSTSADIALSENDPAAAELFVKRLEGLDSKSETTKELRARILATQGKAADAIALLDSIANPSAQIVELRKRIAAVTVTDPVELEKQLASDPKNPGALTGLCNAYRRSNPLKALDYCRRASEAAPQSLEPVVGYAGALVQAKRFEDAVIVLRRIAAIAPDNSTVHAQLGTALFQLKRYAEAKPEFRWLTDRQPDNAIAYYFLATMRSRITSSLSCTINSASWSMRRRTINSSFVSLTANRVNLRSKK
jgi:tetratricopeptide (TPR) repeat protein